MSSLEALIEELYRIGVIRVREGRAYLTNPHLIHSKPDVYVRLLNMWLERLEGLYYNVIVGVNPEGLLYSAMLGLKARKPVAYVIARDGDFLVRGVVSGKYALILSESANAGSTLLSVYRFVLRRGGDVAGFTVLFDGEEGVGEALKVTQRPYIPLIMSSKAVETLGKLGVKRR